MQSYPCTTCGLVILCFRPGTRVESSGVPPVPVPPPSPFRQCFAANSALVGRSDHRLTDAGGSSSRDPTRRILRRGWIRGTWPSHPAIGRPRIPSSHNGRSARWRPPRLKVIRWRPGTPVLRRPHGTTCCRVNCRSIEVTIKPQATPSKISMPISTVWTPGRTAVDAIASSDEVELTVPRPANT